jgi:hypothetical protein
MRRPERAALYTVVFAATVDWAFWEVCYFGWSPVPRAVRARGSGADPALSHPGAAPLGAGRFPPCCRSGWKSRITADRCHSQRPHLHATFDRVIRAFDIQAGMQVRQARLPAGGQAGPMSYMQADGNTWSLRPVDITAWRRRLAIVPLRDGS